MKRKLAYFMAGLVSVALSREFLPAIPLLFVVLVFAGETLGWYRRRVMNTRELINRRDGMYFIQEWPDQDGDPIELGELFDGLYKSGPAGTLRQRADRYRERLRKVGNRSFADGETLNVPVVVYYARAGKRKMETREQYIEFLREAITFEETKYHAAQERVKGGEVYEREVLQRRTSV